MTSHEPASFAAHMQTRPGTDKAFAWNPMARRAWARALCSVLLLVAVPACEDVSKTASDEQKIAAEQVVIRAYADKVPEVDAKLAAFQAAWARANEQRDIKGLKDDISANVKPAALAHVEALAAMPTGSPELLAIHKPLVDAYRQAAAAFDTYLAAVTEDNLDAEYVRLLEVMDKVKVTEAAYLEALKAYYAKHRMTLKSTP